MVDCHVVVDHSICKLDAIVAVDACTNIGKSKDNDKPVSYTGKIMDGRRSFPSVLPSATPYSHALTVDLELGEIPATSGINAYCFQNMSVPVNESLRQEVLVFLSNERSLAKRRLAAPLGRKPCQEWLLSDEELFSHDPTISTPGNEVFCDHSELPVKGSHFSEGCRLWRNIEHDTDIKSSIQERLSGKTKYAYKRTQIVDDIRISAGRLIQQHGNLSEDTVDKYEHHNSKDVLEKSEYIWPSTDGVANLEVTAASNSDHGQLGEIMRPSKGHYLEPKPCKRKLKESSGLPLNNRKSSGSPNAVLTSSALGKSLDEMKT